MPKNRVRPPREAIQLAVLYREGRDLPETRRAFRSLDKLAPLFGAVAMQSTVEGMSDKLAVETAEDRLGWLIGAGYVRKSRRPRGGYRPSRAVRNHPATQEAWKERQAELATAEIKDQATGEVIVVPIAQADRDGSAMEFDPGEVDGLDERTDPRLARWLGDLKSPGADAQPPSMPGALQDPGAIVPVFPGGRPGIGNRQ